MRLNLRFTLVFHVIAIAPTPSSSKILTQQPSPHPHHPPPSIQPRPTPHHHPTHHLSPLLVAEARVIPYPDLYSAVVEGGGEVVASLAPPVPTQKTVFSIYNLPSSMLAGTQLHKARHDCDKHGLCVSFTLVPIAPEPSPHH